MMSLLLFVAAQAAAPPTPPTPAQAEAQARKVLAQRGMSPAGIETMIAADKRHQPAVRAIVQRGAAAEAGIRAALAKQPLDVEGFARATTARAEATGALSREAAQVGIEQIRALSPADRAVVARVATQAPQPRK